MLLWLTMTSRFHHLAKTLRLGCVWMLCFGRGLQEVDEGFRQRPAHSFATGDLLELPLGLIGVSLETGVRTEWGEFGVVSSLARS